MKVLRRIIEYLKFNNLALKGKPANQLEKNLFNKVSLFQRHYQGLEGQLDLLL